jgi:hypothetical protein
MEGRAAITHVGALSHESADDRRKCCTARRLLCWAVPKCLAGQVQDLNDVWARRKKNAALSGPWCNQEQQGWKRRADDGLLIPRQGNEPANELAKLIRKLRLLGMEKERQSLQNELGRRRAAATDSVLATVAETD